MLRPLRSDDFNRGYLKLLAQLTTVGEVDEQTFEGIPRLLYSLKLFKINKMVKMCCKERFNQMKTNGCYYITVIEDLNTSQVVCTATLFTEFKFIHNALIVSQI